jgi:Chaperone of endosialidase/Secretion system C-terminal sorting domain
MKKQTTFSWIIVLFTMTLGFAQNNLSNGIVLTTIPAALPPGNIEAFRFRPGLVTQLDSGTAFDFLPTSQWFSLGRLNSATQTLYGFRVQRAGRGLVFGYTGSAQTGVNPTTAGNPFIQWVGNNATGTPTTTQGNLEFRTSPSSTVPTDDRLAFTLRSDLTALFGETATFVPISASYPSPKVEINSNGARLGLFVGVKFGSTGLISKAGSFTCDTSGSGSGIAGTTAIEATAISNVNTGPAYGVRSLSGYYSTANHGVYSEVLNLTPAAAPIVNPSLNYGVRAKVTSPGLTSSSYGVFSEVNSSTTVGSINYGIFASASGTQATGSGPTGNFAGFFNGHIFASSAFIGSDSKLKKDIKKEEGALEKLQQLNPVTYNFIDDTKKTNLNLPTSLQHGFIAQELEKVYPELVIDMVHPTFNAENEQIGTTTTKAVNYIGLISVLTESLKEMSEEVAVLKDKLASTEKTYVVNNQKNFTESELQAIQMNGFYLGQNTPNPFKTSTVIEYSLPEGETEASILLLNLNGQTLREFKLTAVKGSITIESNTMQKGMYLYSLIANGEEIATKKMIVN